MPLLADRHAARFTLSGPEFEPVGDPAWATAGASERAAFWNEVARLAYEAKRSELNQGLDVHGQKLTRRRRPRPDGATGPVLDPHWSESRFQSYLRYQGEANRAVVWWANPWAIVVQGHATGLATGVVRDVVGLTPRKREWVAKQARKWWANRHRRGEDLGPMGRAHFLGDRGLPPGAVAITPIVRPSLRAPAVATPSFTAELPPWTVVQRLNTVYQAASEANTTEAQIDATIGRLSRLPADTIQAVAVRYGISPTPTTKPAALELIRRQLLDRLREARRLGGAGLPPPPPPPPPKPKPKPKPKLPEPKPARPPKPAPVVAPPITPTPKPDATDLDRRRALVKEQIKPLKRALAIAEEAERDAKAAYDQVRQDPRATTTDRLATRDQWMTAARALEILREKHDRLAEWEGLTRLNPRLIPPLPIADRLAEYTEGDRKLRALAALEGETNPAVRRDRAAEILKAKKALPLNTKPVPGKTTNGRGEDLEPPGPAVQKILKEAIDWYGQILEAAGSQGVPVEIAQFVDPSGRAYAENGKQVVLSESNSAETAIHELAHVIESSLRLGSYRLRAAVQEFLRHRVGNQPARKLAEISPNRGYGPEEIGRDDDFGKVFGKGSTPWYVGKEYRSGDTEVLSMGLQWFSRDPVAFCQKDPEFGKFLIGVLDGSLR